MSGEDKDDPRDVAALFTRIQDPQRVVTLLRTMLPADAPNYGETGSLIVAIAWVLANLEELAPHKGVLIEAVKILMDKAGSAIEASNAAHIQGHAAGHA